MYLGVHLYLWEGGYNFSGEGLKYGPPDIRKKDLWRASENYCEIGPTHKTLANTIMMWKIVHIFKLHVVSPFLTHTFSRQHQPIIFSPHLCHATANCETWNVSYNFLLAKLAYKFWNDNYMYENYSITTKMNSIDVHIVRNVYSCWNVWEFVLF